MTQYEKRTNNFYRRKTLKKEQKRKTHKLPQIPELKSITFEFCTTTERDRFYGCFIEVLKEKKIDKLFNKYVQKGNAITISTSAKKPYRSKSYWRLAVEMLDNMGKHENFSRYYFDQSCINLIKLYTRKGRKHLYLKVGVTEEGGIAWWRMLQKCDLLPGVESMYGVEASGEMYEDW